MGQHLTYMKNKLREPSALVFLYERDRRKTPNKLFLFYEGDEDSSYYNAHVRKVFGAEIALHPFVCNGRKKVLEVLKRITKKYGRPKDALFFIDADHGRYLGEVIPRNKKLYTSTFYSFENYLVSKCALEILFLDLLGLNQSVESIDDCISEYTEAYEKFCRTMTLYTALILDFKARGFEPIAQNLKCNELVMLNLDTSTITKNFCLMQVCTKMKVDRSNYSLKEHVNWAKKLKQELPPNYIRGKWELSFFREFCDQYQDLVIARTSQSESKRILRKKLSYNNFIDYLASRLPTPPRLDVFLKKARREFTR